MGTMVMAGNIPANKVEAQVAFTDGYSWVLIGPGFRQTALIQFAPLPKVSCPIIDLAPIVADDDLIQMVTWRYLSDAGVSDVASLVQDLVALGAVVSHSS